MKTPHHLELSWPKIFIILGFVLVFILFLQDIFRLSQFKQQKQQIASEMQSIKDKMVFDEYSESSEDTIGSTREDLQKIRQKMMDMHEAHMQKMQEEFKEGTKKFDETFEKMRQDFHSEVPQNMVYEFEKNAQQMREAFAQ